MGPVGAAVLQLLRAVLGRFLNLRHADLDVSFWKGDLELRQVELRSDLLQTLGLRIVGRAAVVDRLRVEVPWLQLATKPVRIVLEGVRVTVEADLQARPLRRNVSGSPRATNPKKPGSGWWRRLNVKAAAQNLIVELRDLEVEQQILGARFGSRGTVGLRVQSIEYHAVDAAGDVVFQDPMALGLMHKRLAVRGLHIFTRANGAEEPVLLPLDVTLRGAVELPREGNGKRASLGLAVSASQAHSSSSQTDARNSGGATAGPRSGDQRDVEPGGPPGINLARNRKAAPMAGEEEEAGAAVDIRLASSQVALFRSALEEVRLGVQRRRRIPPPRDTPSGTPRMPSTRNEGSPPAPPETRGGKAPERGFHGQSMGDDDGYATPPDQEEPKTGTAPTASADAFGSLHLALSAIVPRVRVRIFHGSEERGPGPWDRPCTVFANELRGSLCAAVAGDSQLRDIEGLRTRGYFKAFFDGEMAGSMPGGYRFVELAGEASIQDAGIRETCRSPSYLPSLLAFRSDVGNGEATKEGSGGAGFPRLLSEALAPFRTGAIVADPPLDAADGASQPPPCVVLRLFQSARRRRFPAAAAASPGAVERVVCGLELRLRPVEAVLDPDFVDHMRRFGEVRGAPRSRSSLAFMPASPPHDGPVKQVDRLLDEVRTTVAERFRRRALGGDGVPPEVFVRVSVPSACLLLPSCRQHFRQEAFPALAMRVHRVEASSTPPTPLTQSVSLGVDLRADFVTCGLQPAGNGGNTWTVAAPFVAFASGGRVSAELHLAVEASPEVPARAVTVRVPPLTVSGSADDFVVLALVAQKLGRRRDTFGELLSRQEPSDSVIIPPGPLLQKLHVALIVPAIDVDVHRGAGCGHAPNVHGRHDVFAETRPWFHGTAWGNSGAALFRGRLRGLVLKHTVFHESSASSLDFREICLDGAAEGEVKRCRNAFANARSASRDPASERCDARPIGSSGMLRMVHIHREPRDPVEAPVGDVVGNKIGDTPTDQRDPSREKKTGKASRTASETMLDGVLDEGWDERPKTLSAATPAVLVETAYKRFPVFESNATRPAIGQRVTSVDVDFGSVFLALEPRVWGRLFHFVGAARSTGAALAQVFAEDGLRAHGDQSVVTRMRHSLPPPGVGRLSTKSTASPALASDEPASTELREAVRVTCDALRVEMLWGLERLATLSLQGVTTAVEVQGPRRASVARSRLHRVAGTALGLELRDDSFAQSRVRPQDGILQGTGDADDAGAVLEWSWRPARHQESGPGADSPLVEIRLQTCRLVYLQRFTMELVQYLRRLSSHVHLVAGESIHLLAASTALHLCAMQKASVAGARPRAQYVLSEALHRRGRFSAGASRRAPQSDAMPPAGLRFEFVALDSEIHVPESSLTTDGLVLRIPLLRLWRSGSGLRGAPGPCARCGGAAKASGDDGGSGAPPAPARIDAAGTLVQLLEFESEAQDAFGPETPYGCLQPGRQKLSELSEGAFEDCNPARAVVQERYDALESTLQARVGDLRERRRAQTASYSGLKASERYRQARRSPRTGAGTSIYASMRQVTDGLEELTGQQRALEQRLSYASAECRFELDRLARKGQAVSGAGAGGTAQGRQALRDPESRKEVRREASGEDAGALPLGGLGEDTTVPGFLNAPEPPRERLNLEIRGAEIFTYESLGLVSEDLDVLGWVATGQPVNPWAVPCGEPREQPSEDDALPDDKAPVLVTKNTAGRHRETVMYASVYHCLGFTPDPTGCPRSPLDVTLEIPKLLLTLAERQYKLVLGLLMQGNFSEGNGLLPDLYANLQASSLDTVTDAIARNVFAGADIGVSAPVYIGSGILRITEDEVLRDEGGLRPAWGGFNFAREKAGDGASKAPAGATDAGVQGKGPECPKDDAQLSCAAVSESKVDHTNAGEDLEAVKLGGDAEKGILNSVAAPRKGKEDPVGTPLPFWLRELPESPEAMGREPVKGMEECQGARLVSLRLGVDLAHALEDGAQGGAFPCDQDLSVVGIGASPPPPPALEETPDARDVPPPLSRHDFMSDSWSEGSGEIEDDPFSLACAHGDAVLAPAAPILEMHIFKLLLDIKNIRNRGGMSLKTSVSRIQLFDVQDTALEPVTTARRERGKPQRWSSTGDTEAAWLPWKRRFAQQGPGLPKTWLLASSAYLREIRLPKSGESAMQSLPSVLDMAASALPSACATPTNGCQVVYDQAGKANYLRCSIYVHDSVLTMRPRILRRVMRFFVDPVDEIYGRNMRKCLAFRLPVPFSPRTNRDVELVLTGTHFAVPDKLATAPRRARGAPPNPGDLRALLLRSDARYIHAWRGYCMPEFRHQGPGSVRLSVDVGLHTAYFAALACLGASEAAPLTSPVEVRATIVSHLLAADCVDKVVSLELRGEAGSNAGVGRASGIGAEGRTPRTAALPERPRRDQQVVAGATGSWELHVCFPDLRLVSAMLAQQQEDLAKPSGRGEPRCSAEWPPAMLVATEDPDVCALRQADTSASLPLAARSDADRPPEEKNLLRAAVRLDDVSIILVNQLLGSPLLGIDLRGCSLGVLYGPATFSAAVAAVAFEEADNAKVQDIPETRDAVRRRMLAAPVHLGLLGADDTVVTNSEGAAALSIRAFNQGLHRWEPLVEELAVSFVVHRASADADLETLFVIPKPVDANFSVDMYQTIVADLPRLMKDDAAKQLSSHLPPYLVRNATGVAVSLTIMGAGTALEGFDVGVDEQRPLDARALAASSRRHRKRAGEVFATLAGNRESTMSIRLSMENASFASATPVTMDVTGTHRVPMRAGEPVVEKESKRNDTEFRLESPPASSDEASGVFASVFPSRTLAVEISLQPDGTRLVVIRSRLVLTNRCLVALEACAVTQTATAGSSSVAGGAKLAAGAAPSTASPAAVSGPAMGADVMMFHVEAAETAVLPLRFDQPDLQIFVRASSYMHWAPVFGPDVLELHVKDRASTLAVDPVVSFSPPLRDDRRMNFDAFLESGAVAGTRAHKGLSKRGAGFHHAKVLSSFASFDEVASDGSGYVRGTWSVQLYAKVHQEGVAEIVEGDLDEASPEAGAMGAKAPGMTAREAAPQTPSLSGVLAEFLTETEGSSYVLSSTMVPTSMVDQIAAQVDIEQLLFGAVAPDKKQARVLQRHLRKQLSRRLVDLTLQPPMLLHNCLCTVLFYRLVDDEGHVEAEGVLCPGASLTLHHLDVRKAIYASFRIPNHDWSPLTRVLHERYLHTRKERQQIVECFGLPRLRVETRLEDWGEITPPSLCLTVAVRNLVVRVSCPLWIVNTSGLPLEYREDRGPAAGFTMGATQAQKRIRQRPVVPAELMEQSAPTRQTKASADKAATAGDAVGDASPLRRTPLESAFALGGGGLGDASPVTTRGPGKVRPRLSPHVQRRPGAAAGPRSWSRNRSNRVPGAVAAEVSPRPGRDALGLAGMVPAKERNTMAEISEGLGTGAEERAPEMLERQTDPGLEGPFLSQTRAEKADRSRPRGGAHEKMVPLIVTLPHNHFEAAELTVPLQSSLLDMFHALGDHDALLRGAPPEDFFCVWDHESMTQDASDAHREPQPSRDDVHAIVGGFPTCPPVPVLRSWQPGARRDAPSGSSSGSSEYFEAMRPRLDWMSSRAHIAHRCLGMRETSGERVRRYLLRKLKAEIASAGASLGAQVLENIFAGFGGSSTSGPHSVSDAEELLQWARPLGFYFEGCATGGMPMSIEHTTVAEIVAMAAEEIGRTEGPIRLRLLHMAELHAFLQSVPDGQGNLLDAGLAVPFSPPAYLRGLGRLSLNVRVFDDFCGETRVISQATAAQLGDRRAPAPSRSKWRTSEWSGGVDVASQFAAGNVAGLSLKQDATSAEAAPRASRREPTKASSGPERDTTEASNSAGVLGSVTTILGGPAPVKGHALREHVRQVNAQAEHQRKEKAEYELGVCASKAGEPYSSTTILTLVPRYIVINDLQRPVTVAQSSCEWEGLAVPPTEQRAFHWTSMDLRHSIRLRFGGSQDTGDDRWRWSGDFGLDALGEIHLRMRREAGPSEIISVRMSLVGGSVVVLLDEPDSRWPPYRILNRTSHTIRFRQKESFVARAEALFDKGNRADWDAVGPGLSVPYAWDLPLSKKRTLRVEFPQPDGNVSRDFALDELRDHGTIKLIRAIPDMAHFAKEGYMEVRSSAGLAVAWKRMYAVLKDQVVYVFPSHEMQKIVRIVNLTARSTDVRDPLPKRARIVRGEKASLPSPSRAGEARAEPSDPEARGSASASAKALDEEATVLVRKLQSGIAHAQSTGRSLVDAMVNNDWASNRDAALQVLNRMLRMGLLVPAPTARVLRPTAVPSLASPPRPGTPETAGDTTATATAVGEDRGGRRTPQTQGRMDRTLLAAAAATRSWEEDFAADDSDADSDEPDDHDDIVPLAALSALTMTSLDQDSGEQEDDGGGWGQAMQSTPRGRSVSMASSGGRGLQLSLATDGSDGCEKRMSAVRTRINSHGSPERGSPVSMSQRFSGSVVAQSGRVKAIARSRASTRMRPPSRTLHSPPVGAKGANLLPGSAGSAGFAKSRRNPPRLSSRRRPLSKTQPKMPRGPARPANTSDTSTLTLDAKGVRDASPASEIFLGSPGRGRTMEEAAGRGGQILTNPAEENTRRPATPPVPIITAHEIAARSGLTPRASHVHDDDSMSFVLSLQNRDDDLSDPSLGTVVSIRVPSPAAGSGSAAMMATSLLGLRAASLRTMGGGSGAGVEGSGRVSETDFCFRVASLGEATHWVRCLRDAADDGYLEGVRDFRERTNVVHRRKLSDPAAEAALAALEAELAAATNEHCAVAGHHEDEVTLRSLTARVKVWVRVIADGPTRVLELYEGDEGREDGDSLTGRGQDLSDAEDLSAAIRLRGRVGGMRFRVSAPRFGVSFVDKSPGEMLYLSLSEITVGIALTAQKHLEVGVTVETMQLDDQSRFTAFPVVVHPRGKGGRPPGDLQSSEDDAGDARGGGKADATSNAAAGGTEQVFLLPGLEPRALDNTPAIHFFITRRNPTGTPGLLYYDACSIYVCPLDVWLADTFVLGAWHVKGSLDRIASARGAQEALPVADAEDASTWEQRGLMTRSSVAGYGLVRRACISDALGAHPSGLVGLVRAGFGTKVYFALLHVHRLDVLLNYRETGGGEDGSDGDGVLGEAAGLPEPSVSTSRHGQDSGRIAEAVGEHSAGVRWILQLISQLNDAKLRLDPLELHHAFGSQAEVTDKVFKHYSYAAFSQVASIIRSVNVIGNPVGLLTNLGTGVRDFIYEPVHAVTTEGNVTALLGGIGKGSTSLASNTIGGTADFLNKFSSNLGKGLATLSLDSNFQKARTRAHALEAESVSQGLYYGTRELSKGFVDGVSGIVLAPYRGAEKEGLKGFGKGVVQGVLGVAVKPTVAVFDFASRATEGIRNASRTSTHTADWNPTLLTSRVRQPRVFGSRGELVSYAPDLSWAAFLLFCIAGGRYRQERIVWHIRVPCTTIRAEQEAALAAAAAASVAAGQVSELQQASEVRISHALMVTGTDDAASEAGEKERLASVKHLICTDMRLLVVEEDAIFFASKARLVLESPWRFVVGVAPGAAENAVKVRLRTRIRIGGIGSALELSSRSVASNLAEAQLRASLHASTSALSAAPGTDPKSTAFPPGVPVVYDEGAQCELHFAFLMEMIVGAEISRKQRLHPASEHVFCEGSLGRHSRGGGSILRHMMQYHYRLAGHVLYEYKLIPGKTPNDKPLYQLAVAIPLADVAVTTFTKRDHLRGTDKHVIRIVRRGPEATGKGGAPATSASALPAGVSRSRLNLIRMSAERSTGRMVSAKMSQFARNVKGATGTSTSATPANDLDRRGDDDDDEESNRDDDDAPLYMVHKEHLSLYAGSSETANKWAIALDNLSLRHEEIDRSRREDPSSGTGPVASGVEAHFQPRCLYLDFTNAINGNVADKAAQGIVGALSRYWADQ